MTAAAGALAGRLALVTGASRGFGAAVAERLARDGAHVVLLARTVGGLEETDDRVRAAGGTATLLPLDLGEHARIDETAFALHRRFGRLDILVAAAAVPGPVTPLGHLAEREWQRVIDVNLTANWRLVRAMEPLLRLSGAGRAVLVTCAEGALPGAYRAGYAVSKSGLEALARIWAAELATTPVRVNLLDPGPMATRLRAAIFPGEDPATVPPPEARARAIVDLVAPGCTRHGERISAA